MRKRDGKLRISQEGANGETGFSLSDDKDGSIIIHKKSLLIIADEIIRSRPDIAERIVDADQSLAGTETGDIDFSNLSPSHQEEFVRSIVTNFNPNKDKITTVHRRSS